MKFIFEWFVVCTKKFSIRKGLDFDNNSFISAMTSLGKQALRTLTSGNALIQRSIILEEVGPDAFDYGLLIGHEDALKLVRDETADIYVTFPHRSILEFLGAWYFVISLCEEQPVDDLDGALLEYITNTLFFQFCLWFLDESNVMFPFPERSVALEQLGKKIANWIDDETLHLDYALKTKYSAFSFSMAKKNEQVLKVLQNIGTNLSKIKNLHLKELRFPLGALLKALQPSVFVDLRSIHLGEIYSPKEENPLLFISKWQESTPYLDILAKGYAFDLKRLPDILDALEYHFQRLCNYNPSLSTIFSGQNCIYSTMPSVTVMYPKLVRLILNDCQLNTSEFC